MTGARHDARPTDAAAAVVSDAAGPRRRPVTEHDRRRLRTMWRIVVGGPAIGVLGAVLLAAIGGSGRAGLATILLFTAAGCITAALVSLGQAVLDEYRRAPVALRRVGWATALVLATMIALVLLAGVVGAGA